MMNLPTKIVLLTILMTTGLAAQQVRSLSVSEAVSTAINNVEDLKNLRLDEAIQLQKNKEVIGLTMPQIGFSAQGSYYLSTPQVQFPSSDLSVYQVLAREGVKDANGNPISEDNASFSLQNLSFFAPLNFQAGVTVNQLLFQPDVFIAFQARESVLELAKKNVLVAEDKVKESVHKAYYSVLVAQKQKRVLGETMLRLQKLKSDMEAMYDRGFAEKLDIEKIQVTVNNTQTAMNQLNNGLAISYSLLKSTIGIPQSDSLILTETLNEDEIKGLVMDGTTPFNYDQRNEISMLNTAKKLQELDQKRYEMAYLPTVAAFFSYNRNGQRNAKLSPDDPWFWYSTSLVGVSINATIFDGLQRRRKIEQAKLAVQKVDNNMSMVKRMIDLEQDVARKSLNNALLNLEVQQRNTALAQSVFDATRKKYEAGLGSSFELLQADTELQRSQGNYFQALYDAFIAKTSYIKSIGKL
ncbi:MAG: TolC family protein [Saprospiraceae bacterium]|nr:TolC family protein [Saprospiraceae bacterium]